MNASNTIIVVSRYSRPTAWTREFTEKGYVTLVYEHGMADHTNASPNNPYNMNINKGKEALPYLKYIIDKYDSLPTFSIFIHDKQNSWHHQGKITDLVLAQQGKANPYHNFNNKLCASIENTVWKDMKHFFHKYLEPYLGPKEQYGDWTVNQLCCAQFIVQRNKIRKHPRKMYQDIFNWLVRTNVDHETTGRLLEWTWRLIFNYKELAKLQNTRRGDLEIQWKKEKDTNNGKKNPQVVPKKLVDKGYTII